MNINEMYPNMARVMTCRKCGVEKVVNTANKTKVEVIAHMISFICRECRSKMEKGKANRE